MFKLKCGQALCKFPILFSAMKFELRHNFSQFNYMFKMGTFDSWLYFQVFPNSQRDFWMLLQQELLICPNSWKRLNIEILEYFQDFPSSLDSWENWDFSFAYFSFTFCQIVRIVFQAGYICWIRTAKCHYVTILWQVKCWKHFLQP